MKKLIIALSITLAISPILTQASQPTQQTKSSWAPWLIGGGLITAGASFAWTWKNYRNYANIRDANKHIIAKKRWDITNTDTICKTARVIFSEIPVADFKLLSTMHKYHFHDIAINDYVESKKPSIIYPILGYTGLGLAGFGAYLKLKQK